MYTLFRPLILLSATVATLTAAIPTGPEIGATIPPFHLVDQNGREQSLASITGPQGALLVFYRSADW